jgi:hypothetical protein
VICPCSRNLALALWLTMQVNALASLPCLCQWGPSQPQGVFAAQLEAADPAQQPCGLCDLGSDARQSQDGRTAPRPADRLASVAPTGAVPSDRPIAFNEAVLSSTAPHTTDARQLRVFLE